jgi:hypothetical protein
LHIAASGDHKEAAFSWFTIEHANYQTQSRILAETAPERRLQTYIAGDGANVEE